MGSPLASGHVFTIVRSPGLQRRTLAAFVVIVIIFCLSSQGVKCFTEQAFAYFVIGSLFLWTLIEAFAHHRELSVLERDLREGTDLVKGTADEAAFYDRYEDLRSALAMRPSIQHAWQEFSEEVFADDPTRRMRNATQPSAHFTLETLAHGRVNLRWYGSFPNLLVGVGIIGTFLGLAAGIKLAAPGLTGDVAGATASLKDMLGGAFVAFSKSAAGLFFSVCFTLYERRRANKVDEVIREFTEALEERLVLTTPQHLAFEQLRELREQTAILKKFNTALAPAIAEAAPALADALNSRIGERLEPLLERLHDALVAIKGRQEESVRHLVRSAAAYNELNEHLKALRGSVSTLGADRTRSNEAALEGLARQFREAMSAGAGKELQGLATSLAALQATLERSGKALDGNRAEFEATNRRMAAVLEESLGGVRRDLADVVAKLSETMGSTLLRSVETASERIAAGGAAFSDQVGTRARELDAALGSLQTISVGWRELLESTAGLTAQMKQVALEVRQSHAFFNSVVDGLGTSSAAVRVAAGEMAQTAGAQAASAEQLATAASALGDGARVTRQAWEEYRARFEKVDVSLQATFEQLDRGLARYSQQVGDFVLKVDQHLSRATQSLAGAVSQLDETVSDLPGEVEKLGRQVEALRRALPGPK